MFRAAFLISANAGEAPGKINRIASGGELSRIMLALKNVLAVRDRTPAMVFDEIDTGVSGVAAQRVGEKLAALSRTRQVICGASSRLCSGEKHATSILCDSRERKR